MLTLERKHAKERAELSTRNSRERAALDATLNALGLPPRAIGVVYPPHIAETVKQMVKGHLGAFRRLEAQHRREWQQQEEVWRGF